jgi:hypothetical protein
MDQQQPSSSCCAVGLRSVVEVREGVRVEQCETCGRRHIVMVAEPGRIGMRL